MENNDNSLGAIVESITKIGKAAQQNLSNITSEVIRYSGKHPIGFNRSSLLIDPYERLGNIEIPPNPLIALNEEQLSEIRQLNTSIDALNKKIVDLEIKANKSEQNNVKRQWTIAISSTILAAIVGSILTMITTLLLAKI